jgi:EAL domain-containing protein (putative c-di-GMP-specific phosphodiesterase class I)
VVAEGVETREQLNYLRAQGCDKLQGFLFSRALPAEEVQVHLAKGKIELTF